jgi:hypothetical protein
MPLAVTNVFGFGGECSRRGRPSAKEACRYGIGAAAGAPGTFNRESGAAPT